MYQGIRVIKYYNWEPAFKQRVQQIRDEQMKQTLNVNFPFFLFFILFLILLFRLGNMNCGDSQ